MGEETPVAVLFSDIRGFTSYTAEKGDREAYRLARTFLGIVEEQVARHEGRVVKTYGDGVMTSFSQPEPAVRCSVAMQEALRGHNAAAPEKSFCVGIGLTWGEALRTEEDDLFGHTVNLAKRLADLAKGCQVVVVQALVKLVPNAEGVRYRDLGEREIEGIGRERLYEVVWRREAQRLEAEDGALDVVLTGDGRLVFELSKGALERVQRVEEKLRRVEAKGRFAGVLARQITKRMGGPLPDVVSRALLESGLGVEHDLGEVEASLSEDGLVVRLGGRKPIRLNLVGRPSGEAREFVETLQKLKGAPGAGWDRWLEGPRSPHTGWGRSGDDRTRTRGEGG